MTVLEEALLKSVEAITETILMMASPDLECLNDLDSQLDTMRDLVLRTRQMADAQELGDKGGS